MKNVLKSEQTVVQVQDSLQSRIALVSEKGFLWREIAELAGLPKKLVKGLAKGEFVLTEDESERLSKVFDETIDRLKNSTEPECPEQDIDAEDYEFMKLEVRSVTLFKVWVTTR